MSEAVAPHGGNVRVFLMDEARLGRQGTVTKVWAPTGSRPTAVKQTRYEWVYPYAPRSSRRPGHRWRCWPRT